MYDAIVLKNLNLPFEQFQLVEKILKRKLDEISSVRYGSGLELTVALDDTLRRDQYRIEDTEKGLQITGGTRLGVIGGIGHILQDGSFEQDAFFTPGGFRGLFTPRCELRGAYFASHFGNFYETAPLEELEHLLEDLALWGQSIATGWFDFHKYTDINDPKAEAMKKNLHRVLGYANKLGMYVNMTFLANEGYSVTPDECRAEWKVQGSYTSEPNSHYHTEICPNKPGGMELILKNRRAFLEEFKDIEPSVCIPWVYDQGGCTCPKCDPYGGRGYFKILPELKKLYKEYFPNAQFGVCSWYLDKFAPGEWELMYKTMAENPEEYGDYKYISGVSITAANNPPQAILEGKGPGNTRPIGFPELSMRGCLQSWGGFGSNPFPRFVQEEWDKAGKVQVGMWTYSEGIYEDINKVMTLGLYSGRFQTAREAMENYIRFEISPEYVDEICEILYDLEECFGIEYGKESRRFTVENPECRKIEEVKLRVDIPHPEKIPSIFERITAIDQKLPYKRRHAWRWRLILLRASIDYALYQNNFYVNDAVERYMDELNCLYYVSDITAEWMRPVKRERAFHVVNDTK